MGCVSVFALVFLSFWQLNARVFVKRHIKGTQTTLEVQASLEADSTRTTVHTLSRPIRESGWIQHQGQPRDRTLMARERGSTGYSSDVTEAGQMAASLRKIPATASLMTTSREARENERDCVCYRDQHYDSKKVTACVWVCDREI